MTSEHEEIRRRLAAVPPATPPPDLADKIKAAIPADLARSAKRRDDGNRAAWWRMAASVLMLFGFTYIAMRTYLESRAYENAKVATPPVIAVEEPVATAASSTSVAGADRELKDELRHDELLAMSEEAAPAPQPTTVAQAKPDRRLRSLSPRASRDEVASVEEAAAPPAFSPEPEREEKYKEEDDTAAEAAPIAAAAPPPPPQAAAAAPAPASRAEGAAAPRGQRLAAKGVAADSAVAQKRSDLAVIERVEPEIPETLLERDIRGTIWLHVEVDRSGSVTRVRLIRGVHDEIDEAYLNAIRRWKFAPAGKEERGTREVTIRIDYPENR